MTVIVLGELAVVAEPVHRCRKPDDTSDCEVRLRLVWRMAGAEGLRRGFDLLQRKE